jgi:hypothetical protein
MNHEISIYLSMIALILKGNYVNGIPSSGPHIKGQATYPANSQLTISIH